MPLEKKIVSELPQDVREEFDRRIIAGEYKTYLDFHADLSERGLEVSRSTAHAYFKEIRDSIPEMTGRFRQYPDPATLSRPRLVRLHSDLDIHIDTAQDLLRRVKAALSRPPETEKPR
ncbi:phage protein Gp27 family protein [Methylomagnum ishizawai]|uniref:phage protein Gp27 family protein n=1 Tax=Methylomagnum ishizawai TaxID=1760988 RepID=UPI001C33002A|nr:phage protein Gp27 family protein [Methylomagnum ishizawai]BBL75058.1 hypothetical protein MishRS11D_21560 [Methylomagnum ishizawai]